VAVYDSYAYQGLSGWLVFGGTSVASPIVASVYALAGSAGSNDTLSAYPYKHYPTSINDVPSGSNGSCGGSYLCTAEPNAYDGPSGLGTPNGTSAFQPASGFVLSASPTSSASVSAGTTCGTITAPCSTISLASQNGYAGTVNLAASAPSGITASLSPSFVSSGSATSGLTVTVGSTLAAGAYSVKVTGTDSVTSSMVSSTTFTVNVVKPDFSISASPVSATSTAGTTCGTATLPCSTITLTSQNGYSGAISLTASGPAGVSPSLATSSVSLTAGSSATVGLNVGVAANQPAASDVVTVSATDNANSHNASFTVNVADFTMSASPASARVASGATCSACTTVTLNPKNGYNAPVNVSVSTPSGITVSPSSFTGSITGTSLSISVVQGLASGPYAVTIFGSDGTNTQQTTFTVNVGTSDYSISVSPSTRQAKHGSSATYTVTVSAIGSYTNPVTLSVSGLPSGATPSFSPNPVTIPAGSTSTQSTLTVSTVGWVARGTYALTISALDGTHPAPGPITLTIT